MAATILLLSIRPEYAEKIFKGDKRVELRRTQPRLDEGDLVVVYASSPQKALIGIFKVKKVIKKPLEKLWDEVKDKAGISYEEFCEYYKGVSVGCGIFFKKTYNFPHPVELEKLKKEWNDFTPPQSYRYLKPSEINIVENITQFDISKIASVYQPSLEVF